jgi:hypothetical protein
MYKKGEWGELRKQKGKRRSLGSLREKKARDDNCYGERGKLQLV